MWEQVAKLLGEEQSVVWMISRFMRRSGISAGLICHHLDWRPDLVIQVGVGLSHHEVDVFKQEWPDVGFIGFEPHPEIYEKVSIDYPGRLHRLAIGEEAGSSTLYHPPNHKDSASMFPFYQRGRKQSYHLVRQVTLDDELMSQALPPHILLWLDCEGSELGALRGAPQLLNHTQFINVELTAKPCREGWCSSVEVHTLLSQSGFWLQWLHTQRTSAGQCDVVYVRRELFKSEYCCVPHELERWNLYENQEKRNGS